MNAAAAGQRLQLRAVLPPPPGLNSTYRSAGDVWYKSARARAWEDEALLLLRQAGFRTQPLGSYWLGVELTVSTCRLDIDSACKITLDVLEEALGINDRCVGHLCVSKHLVAHLSEQNLEVRCEVRRIAGKSDFNALSERAVPRPDDAPLLTYAPLRARSADEDAR